MADNVLTRYRQALAEAIASAAGVPVTDVLAQLKAVEPPHGDLAYPTFALAKAQKKAPPAIAAQLAAAVKVDGISVVAAGPYLNATFLPQPFHKDAIDAARTTGTRYGHSQDGAGKTVVIDYSSPNIAKPIGFHHIRSTVIGHSLANLYRSQGYSVAGLNYLGDWGKQFGLVAVGFQEFGDPALREDVKHLVSVYVKANEKAKADKTFDERAREFFRKMENGDAEALKLWREFRETSLRDFKQIYGRLGIEFQSYEGESQYQGKMDAVIEEITRTVGTKESEGALIVDLPYKDNEPPVLLKKNDGSTLYATRDLAAANDRYERFKFTKSLYVVATDQSLHFRQFFGVLEKMGKPWAKDCVHVNFGRIGQMSTRLGKIVLLSDVLNEAHTIALEKVRENIAAGKIETENPEALAEQIGLGAICFGDLKNRRTSDYDFDMEEVLSFEGHTGPYLQYAHARCCAILRRGGGAPAAYDAALLNLPEEAGVIRAVAKLPVMIQDAVNENEPSHVARHLLDVAAAFSRWYTLGNQEREKRVLVEDNEPLRAARLALTDSVRITLSAGLSLLGIASPERM